MPAASTIVELRRFLADRLPHQSWGLAATPPPETHPTGVPALDTLLEGGLARGVCTELIGHGPGSAQILHSLLRRIACNKQFLALVDGADSFDVTAVEPGILVRLLWARCSTASQALQAADLLLRDRNFPFLALDLCLNPMAQLRKIPSSTWHRYARLIEHHRTMLLVVTPFQLVSHAAWRVQVESNLGVDTLATSPEEWLPQLHFTLLRQPAATHNENHAAAAAG